MSGYGFRFSVPVRFRDLDTLGHVNNAVYLTYLESARIAYWMEVSGRPLQEDYSAARALPLPDELRRRILEHDPGARQEA